MTTNELVKILQDADPGGVCTVLMSPDLYYAWCRVVVVKTSCEGDTLRVGLELEE